MIARQCAYLWQEVPLGYEVCLIERGGADWWSAARTFRSRAGSVCIIPPGELHRALAVAEHSDFRVLSLPAELVASLDGDRGTLGARRQMDSEDVSTRLRALFAQLAHEAEPIFAEVALAEFVSTAVGPPREAVRAPARAERMRALIHARYSDPLGLSELAQAADLTKVQAVRLFARSFGTTPCHYLMLLRTSQARRLLAQGHDAATVAYTTGFADQSHLHRWFKRLYLLSPGCYARSGSRAARAGPSPRTQGSTQ